MERIQHPSHRSHNLWEYCSTPKMNLLITYYLILINPDTVREHIVSPHEGVINPNRAGLLDVAWERGGGGLMTFSAKLNFILSTEVMSLMRICYSNTLFYSSSKTWSSNALFYSSSKAHHFNDRKRLCSCRYKLMSLMRIYSSKICSFKPLLDSSSKTWSSNALYQFIIKGRSF